LLSRALFQAAVSACRGTSAPKLRFTASNTNRFSARPVPRRSDGGFEGYLKRAAAESRSRDVTFVLNESQASSGVLFESCLRFLSGLLEHTGIPMETDAVIFATRSRVSALGVHRDPYGNFVFAAEGEKTFLLWPRDAVPGQPVVAPESALEALRSSAQRFHLKAGDALYIPGGYYHCTLQDGFSVHLSLILSTDADMVVHRFIWRELETFLYNCFDGSGESTFTATDGITLNRTPIALTRPLRRGLAKARGAEPLMRSAALRTQSADGFWSSPPEREHPPLKPSDRVEARRSNLRVAVSGDAMLVAACGHLYSCPAHPLLLAMLETLATGEPILVRDLLRRFTGTAWIGDDEVLLDSRWLRVFLLNLCKARWLKLSGSRRSGIRARKS
jgi:hypothetical protein